ncbi:MAG TPA: hypothetical protein DHW70_03825 [Candidatus Atribacteria bacterium]|nr:hypothetical protein [Candidatus Atribacteria bacterium]
MIVLLIIEYILAICLILIMLVFFVPIFFNIQISKYNGLVLWVKVNWLFNAFYCYIEKKRSQKPVAIVKILGLKIPIERERAPKKKKEKIKKKFDFRALLNKPFLTKVFQFIKKVLKHIVPQEFRVRLSYGFDNPAHTGILCGFIALFSAYFSGYDIFLDPIFDQEILEGELFLKGRLFGFVITYYILQLVLSKTFRKTIKEAKKIN